METNLSRTALTPHAPTLPGLKRSRLPPKPPEHPTSAYGVSVAPVSRPGNFSAGIHWASEQRAT